MYLFKRSTEQLFHLDHVTLTQTSGFVWSQMFNLDLTGFSQQEQLYAAFTEHMC